MRVSVAALVFVLGNASAFVQLNPPTVGANFPSTTLLSSIQRHFTSTPLYAAAVKSPPTFPTPKVTSKTSISTDTSKMKDIMEARGLLLEIETAAEMARDYLEYLDNVASVIRSFLQGQSLLLPEQPSLDVFPDLSDVQQAQTYLANIEKATSSASDYLNYLENMASGIKLYLQKFQKQYNVGGVTSKTAAQAQEAKVYMSSLDETSEAAHAYLDYLKRITTTIQNYLVDPSLNGIQELLMVSPPPTNKEERVPPAQLSARATRVIPKVHPDVSHNARPTYRIAGIPMSEIKSSAKKKKKSTTTEATTITAAAAAAAATSSTAAASTATTEKKKTSSSPRPTKPLAVGGTATYLDSMRSNASTTRPSPSSSRSFSSSSASTSYLDSIALSSYSVRKAAASANGSSSYLDSIMSTTPPPRRANGHLQSRPRPTISLSAQTTKQVPNVVIPDVDKKDLSSAAADGVIVGGSKKQPKTAKVRVVPAGGGGAVPNPVERSKVVKQQQQSEPPTPAKPLQPLAREPVKSRKSGTKGTLRFFMSRVKASQDPDNS